MEHIQGHCPGLSSARIHLGISGHRSASLFVPLCGRNITPITLSCICRHQSIPNFKLFEDCAKADHPTSVHARQAKNGEAYP